MTNATGPDAYIGRNAVDPQGNKIGSVGQVYLNDETGQPDWVTVNTGLFGTKEHFAPLAGSSFNGDALVLPFDKSVVKDAPDVADASHLDVDEQEALYCLLRPLPGRRHRIRATTTERPLDGSGTTADRRRRPATSAARATTPPARTPTTR